MTEEFDAGKLALLIVRIKECVAELIIFQEELGRMLGVDMPDTIYIPKRYKDELLDWSAFVKELDNRRKRSYMRKDDEGLYESK